MSNNAALWLVMTFETGLVRMMSVVFASTLALGACGDGESDGPTEEGGGGAGEDGETGGSTSQGGATGGRAASTGGRTAAAGAAGETGGVSSATGGRSSTPSGDCETPSEPIEHCYADNDDRPGTAVCSEYYAVGVAALFCAEPEADGCPQNEELAAACIGGLTSSYYYTDASNEGFWDAGEGGCEVNSGEWCSF